jgi:hypothetical protein
MNSASIRSPLLSLASTCLVGLAAVAAACGPAQPPAAQPPVAPGGSAADTPVPPDGQCDFVNYHHDEARNAKGASKCASDCDCDGMRSCVSGACQGTARPDKLTPETCNRKEYHYRESWTPAGAGKCANDCECDGLRSCVSGQCTGSAR